ncbi:MAG: hypothetical protein ACKVQA_12620 [Burkholderiales bacterium]
MRLVVLLILALSVMPARAEGHDHHGTAGCDQYPWDMNREWSLMITDPFPMQSVVAMDVESRYVPLDRRVQFALHPSAKVKLAVTPRKTPAATTFAGMGLIRLPYGKKYRISTREAVWIDVAGPAGLVPATKTAMLGGCERLVKTVIFPLESETDYWLQITGSANSVITLLITLDR